MDYSTLANIARPQMMGNAPMGAGFTAGVDYGRQQDQFNGFLAQAAQQSQRQAEMEAMKAEEFSRGAPGRNAQIDMGNQMAQGQLGNLPDLLSAQSNTAKAGAQEASNKLNQAQQEALVGHATEYEKAKSPEEKKRIIEDLKVSKIQIGPKNTANLTDEQADQMLRGIWTKVNNSPKAELERYKADKSYEKGVATASINAQSRERVAQISAQAKQMAAQLAKEKPETINQVLGSIAKAVADGTATELQKDTYIHYYEMQKVIRQAGAPQNPVVNPDIAPGVLQPKQDIPLPGVPGPTAAPKAAAGPKPIPKEEAKRRLAAFKNTAQYEAAKKFYEQTYGEKAPE